MGDARFDQVVKRTRAAGDSPWPGRLASAAHFVLVAGSTWPADEEVLLRALRLAGERSPPLRLVLAPHEPTPDHLRATETLLGKLGFSSQRLAAVEEEPIAAEVVLVDRVGILGDLYAAGAAAYVGGGWGTAGLHSVLEPAAFGLPVLFGPRHANAREAGELVTAGGAFSVDDGDELRDRIAELWGDEKARRRAGVASAAYVEAGRGAAERGAGVVLANGEL
jgi:3-deoxy-D-manno-octulosonic-acid transferase